jgi:hypothetical protein
MVIKTLGPSVALSVALLLPVGNASSQGFQFDPVDPPRELVEMCFSQVKSTKPIFVHRAAGVSRNDMKVVSNAGRLTTTWINAQQGKPTILSSKEYTDAIIDDVYNIPENDINDENAMQSWFVLKVRQCLIANTPAPDENTTPKSMPVPKDNGPETTAPSVNSSKDAIGT